MIVARGHKQFHPPKPPSFSAFKGFFNEDFPAAVRRFSPYVLASALLFALPILFTSLAVVLEPSVAYRLAPPAMLDSLTDAYAQGHQGGRSEGLDSIMTGYYIRNNIGIAFECFATGIFFGIGSIYTLIINGVISGAVGVNFSY